MTITSKYGIRSTFARELTGLGIDCYSVYTQDTWHPHVYIPHDIDPHLFYPEPMFGAPGRRFCEQIVQDTIQGNGEGSTKFTLPQVIHSTFFRDAKRGPRIDPLFDTSVYGKWELLFQGFANREGIVSSAVFVPEQPVIRENMLPEVLFFNFRSEQRFDKKQRFSLALLANAIFASIEIELSRRKKYWQTALLWTTRCQSSLTSIFNDGLVYQPGEHSEASFVEYLLENLYAHLKRPQERLLASVYLLRRDRDTITLNRCGKQSGEMGKGDFLREQICYSADSPSITVCTAITGRAHLLNHIDPPGQTSIELMLHEYRSLAESSLAPNYALRPPTFREPPRLILFFESNEKVHEATILETIKVQRVAQKLIARHRVQYSDIFGELDSVWPRPCSEVCVPIYAGQQLVGCVNIESNVTYRFNPSALNVLVAVSTIVGAAVMQRDNARMLDEVQKASEAFHTSQHPDMDSLRLNELAKQVARTLGCRSIDIEIATGPDGTRPEYSLIATSRESHDEHGFGSWTTAVTKSRPDNASAVIVDLAESREIGELSVYDVFEVGEKDSELLDRVRHRHLDAGSWHDNVRYRLVSRAVAVLAPDLQRVSRKLDIVIGVSIGASENLHVSQLPQAILWATFSNRPFALRDEQWANQLRRDGLLRHLLSTAERCSVVPLTWSSQALSAIRFNRAMHHGGLIDTLEKVSFELQRAEIEFQKLGESSKLPVLGYANITEHIAKASYLSKYLCSHLNVARRISGTNDVRQHSEAVEALAHSWSLRELCDESWRVVTAHFSHRDQTIRFVNSEDISIRVSIDEISEMLTLILSNCVLHGSGRNGIRTAIVDWRREGERSVRLRISDESMGVSPRSTDTMTNRHTLGVTTIRKIASVICVNGEYEYLPASYNAAAEWSFMFLEARKRH